MEFQKLLLDANKALGKREVRALVFLCSDLLGGCPTVESAGELFRSLGDQDLLSEEQPHLLSELLCIIQRRRLLRNLDLSSSVQSNRVSAYRKLLYHLSEELTEEDLKNIKFLLSNKLPRKKLEDNVTTLEVFMEMEHMDLISETNLNLLESIVREVCPVLLERIRRFKAQDSGSSTLTIQETGQLRFEPPPPQQPQVPFGQPVSTEKEDPTSMFNDQDGGEAGPPGRTALLAETSTCESTREENQSASRTETCVTSKAKASLETYPMAGPRRGCCLIINNHDFRECGRGMRDGTMVDERCLSDVFHWLGFEVEICRDCTSEEMLSLMQKLADRSQQDWDCLVCCVLSHGLEGRVFGVDGNTVNIRMLMEPFTKCPSMAGKPKLFFIQACQGNNSQRVVYTDSDRPQPSDVGTSTVPTTDCIPHHADFLLGMATVPDFVSFREREYGTWYVQSLCESLVDMVPGGIDLMSILTKVNADVSKKSFGSRKQMPQPAFTLRKKIVFPVPRGPIPALPNFSTC